MRPTRRTSSPSCGRGDRAKRCFSIQGKRRDRSLSVLETAACIGCNARAWPSATLPREKSRWQGVTSVSDKRVNPSWTPTAEMRRENPRLPVHVAGGHPMNPLGVRALYLGSSMYRIHGTDAPWTIGTAASKGCIRRIGPCCDDRRTRFVPLLEMHLSNSKKRKSPTQEGGRWGGLFRRRRHLRRQVGRCDYTVA
jgi:hypothetical protein